MQKKIEQEQYLIGEVIVPRTYKKITVDINSQLQEKIISVSGRKIPLIKIRERELERIEKMGLIRARDDQFYDRMTDEQVEKRLKELGEFDVEQPSSEWRNALKHLERTRHLLIWHDNSTLLNNGHLLMMVTVLYDPAFFFTSEEMIKAGYGQIDVRAEVEKPQIYILARCGSSEVDQLCYIDTRKQCLKDLELPLKTANDVSVRDVMRFFHGDGPAQEFEIGEQKGGHAGCSGCKSDCRNYYHIDYNLRCSILTMSERQKKVLAGPAGKHKRNGGVKPFKNMTLEELQTECSGRGLSDEGKRPDLEKTLKEELGGIQRVPAMLIHDQDKDLSSLMLPMYEVLPTEPLHDIKEHISNTLKELPKHLNTEELAQYVKVKEATLDGKQCLKGSDYRKACVIIAQNMRGVLKSLNL